MINIRIILKTVIVLIFIINASYAAHKHHTLLSYHYVGEFTKNQAMIAVKETAPLNTLNMNYDFKLYKVLYTTPGPDGRPVTASGLVAIPNSPKEKVDIVSYQHGTRVYRGDAPTTNLQKNFVYPAVFTSSGGYMLSMPDYLGLGDNDLNIQPYVDARTLATTSIDMLIAAKELAEALYYPVSKNLFLTGYSEGGFSTMVMYQELLKNHPEIHVNAAAPGSAPYDWDETMTYIIDGDGPRSSLYLGLYFYSMQYYNHYWANLSNIFKKPYDTLIPNLYDGSHQTQEIIDALPLDPRQLLQETFIQGLLNRTDPHITELRANINHYNFISSSPLLLISTKGDHDLPFHGAEIAYDALKKNSDLVYLRSVSDTMDHVQAFPYVTKEQLEFFNSLKHH